MSLAVQLTSSLSIGNRLLQLSRAVKQLFAAGEQGVWYDPSDFSTLFQDSAGTTPVTAVEQPVGLLLDKSKGLVLGPELVTNGDFSNGTSGWASGTSATLSNVSGELLVTSAGLTYGGAVQSFVTVVGKTYKLTATLRLGTATLGWMMIGTSSQGNQYTNIPVVSTSSATVTYYFVATTTTTYIGPQADNTVSNGTIYADNISVRELPGNHATQATAGNRPILRQDGNGCYYLAFNGTSSSMATGSIDFTATDKMTVFAGVRKLSDAALGMICEFSSLYSSLAGAFAIYNTVGGSYKIASGGTTFSEATSSVVAAPISNVLTEICNISSPVVTLRVNGSQAATSSATQGTGNFGNYPLYIGARAGTSLFYNGNLYSLIVRGAQSSAAQITSAETYVNSKTKAY